MYCFLHCLSLDVISDRIDINVLKIPLSTCSPVSGHIKIILETVIYRGEKSLLVLIYSSDSYNLGALTKIWRIKIPLITLLSFLAVSAVRSGKSESKLLFFVIETKSNKKLFKSSLYSFFNCTTHNP